MNKSIKLLLEGLFDDSDDINDIINDDESVLDTYMSSYTPADPVDLGLPSGTKWSNMNIGAKAEVDTGLYFQWGDTVGYTTEQIGSGDGQKEMVKDDYKFITKWHSLTKYTSIDLKITLEKEDDAATVNMGNKWKMPTNEQFEELIEETVTELVSKDNVKGIMFTSKKYPNKYVFFPACGVAYNGKVDGNSEYGAYWSSSRDNNFIEYAENMLFGKHIKYKIKTIGILPRKYGLPIRAVLAL